MRLILSGLIALAALYCFGGVLQAASLFTGHRALLNFNHWAGLGVLALSASIFIALAPWRWIRSVPTSVLAVYGGTSLLISIAIAVPVVLELGAASQCVAIGGSYNHVESLCDHQETHRALSMWQHGGFRISSASVLAGVGVAALACIPFRRRGGAS
jgi:hypothetical protein